MNKRKVLASVMTAAMTLSMSGQFVFAKGNEYMNNSSFENTIKNSEVQLYKAQRTKEKAYDGNYSIKVGMEKPK